MQTVINVKCGKPVLKLKYRTLRAVQVCSLFVCAITFLYCFNLFTLAIRLKATVSIYVDLISNNGIVFPGLISLTSVIGIFINIFIVYYLVRAFSSSKNKFLNSMLFMFVMVCLLAIFMFWLISICVLLHTYSSHEEVHDGIINAMYNYSKDSLIKAKVDLMQIENACCGSKNYTDWYTIRWYDANLINTEAYPNLKGEAPYSCCSITSIYPCIHHGIEAPSSAYIYSKEANISVSLDGCHEIILKVKETTGWLILFRIFLLSVLQTMILIGLRIIQTAHTERKAFDREDKLYTCWIMGCYAGKSRQALPPPVPATPTDQDDLT